MMLLHRQNQRGFTLIEMLLVVVILGVATLYSMSFIRTKQRENDIKNTAQQMKNILQLGHEYHSRFDEWPSDTSELESNMGVNALDFCTRWPGPGPSTCPLNATISVAPEDSSVNPNKILDDRSSYQNIVSGDPRLEANFTVTLTLTAPYTNASSSQIDSYAKLVKSIAYYLPTAIVSDNDTKITLYTSARISIPPPEYTFGYITHSGFGKTGQNIPVAEKCYQYLDVNRKPVEMEKHAHIAMMYGVTDTKRWWTRAHWYSVRANVQNDSQLIIFLQSQASGCTKRGDCHINFNDGSYNDDSGNLTWKRPRRIFGRNEYILTASGTNHYLVYYYLSMCVPYKMWQASSDTSFTNSVVAPSQQAGAKLLKDTNAGQCGGNWMCASSRNNIYKMLKL